METNMFVMESILTDGIAQLSYLVGDTSTGHAAVIDPRTDVEIYLEKARQHGLSITHIFETHIHADFVSGSRSLHDLVATADVILSGEQADYDFAAAVVQAGQSFDFGSFLLTARHTPGHTPEHMSFELSEAGSVDQPWAVFTGASLFVGSAGRPDLLGAGSSDELTERLYETLYEYFLKLDDYVVIFPGHGAGSACGADIGDRLVSTIGYERRTNDFLRCHSLEAFHRFVMEGAPPIPSHYPLLKKVNAAGPDVMPRLPSIPALTPREFRAATREAGVTLVDTRSMLAFGGGHVPGAINIGDRPELSAWMGQMIDPDQKILLIVHDDAQVEAIQRLIVRTGHFHFAGYLTGGMKAWEADGLPLEHLPQLTVIELNERMSSRSKLNVLDVRSPGEFESGHIPQAKHYFVGDMQHRIDGLDKDEPIATYCASGYRASIAASLMQARGFKDVTNIPGSFDAWKAANLPIEMPQVVATV